LSLLKKTLFSRNLQKEGELRVNDATRSASRLFQPQLGTLPTTKYRSLAAALVYSREWLY
jgi:hypothetical protein